MNPSPPTAVPLDEWLRPLHALPLHALVVQATLRRRGEFRSGVGGVLRGLVGDGLRGDACLTGAPQCRGCAEDLRCPYARLFGAEETRNAARNDVPKRWWLRSSVLSRRTEAGERLKVELRTLAFTADEREWFREHLEDAIMVAGDPKGPENLLDRLEDTPLSWPDARPPTVRVHRWRLVAESPWDLRGDTHRAESLCPKVPGFGLLAMAVVRRVLGLVRAAEAAPPPRLAWPDLRGVRQVGGSVDSWRGSRWTERQGQWIPREGIVGEPVLEGEGVTELVPLLRTAALISVGKATTEGLGALRIEHLP